MKAPDPSCANCHHKFPASEGLFCRAHPPQATQIVVGHNDDGSPKVAPFSQFTVVLPDWYCGEFKRAAKTKKPNRRKAP